MRIRWVWHAAGQTHRFLRSRLLPDEDPSLSRRARRGLGELMRPREYRLRAKDGRQWTVRSAPRDKLTGCSALGSRRSSGGFRPVQATSPQDRHLSCGSCELSTTCRLEGHRPIALSTKDLPASRRPTPSAATVVAIGRCARGPVIPCGKHPQVAQQAPIPGTFTERPSAREDSDSDIGVAVKATLPHGRFPSRPTDGHLERRRQPRWIVLSLGGTMVAGDLRER